MIQLQDYPFTLKRAVPEAFCDYVNALIQSNIEQFKGNQAGAARKFMKMDYVSPDGDQVLYAMKEKLAQHFDIGDYVVPPNLKDFVGYITEGGRDPSPHGCRPAGQTSCPHQRARQPARRLRSADGEHTHCGLGRRCVA